MLFAALCYEQPVILEPIDPEANLADVDAEEENQDVDGVAPVATQVVDVSQAMAVRDHWILDDTALIGEVSSCLQGVDVNAVVDSSTRDQVIAAKIHLARRLERRLLRLDPNLRYTFVWSACRDNIHPFA